MSKWLLVSFLAELNGEMSFSGCDCELRQFEPGYECEIGGYNPYHQSNMAAVVVVDSEQTPFSTKSWMKAVIKIQSRTQDACRESVRSMCNPAYTQADRQSRPHFFRSC